ncbi:hypothetical protein PsYK624_137800 [Phanerochaete sordida]|uniref:Heterokaryon incompatibility domain-containing protein n=1 Tax=Phanerochaete sordida TaxID=48140 RepID=A0A9P3GNN6_9APHY|nr:hypothetical protein PsYK624_137800 [Phanerochaete sordida]
MATSGSIPIEILFTSSRPGKKFTLRPEPRSPIPFQWVHVGARTIPHSLADTLCSTMTSQALLSTLNDVLGTDDRLYDRGVRECLEHFVHSEMDFGQAYGCLRHFLCWDKLNTLLKEKREEDEHMRGRAISGAHIANARVPPRRVWDLCSNRVLPYYVLHKTCGEHIRTVSHSWAPPSARQLVDTPVNGREWPVPIPQDTSLEHIRIELLNLGAEYVWLDVLCLRQHGRPEDEARRLAEWRLDVPTIGRIYSCGNTCITYFNGLGRPFDASPDALASPCHWLQRVWTVQETTERWLPAGTTGSAYDAARAFFREHLPRAIPDTQTGALGAVVHAIRTRSCTTELDRVHGLAYVLGCATLPVYEEGMPPARAWVALLKHLYPSARAMVAWMHICQCPESTALLPSWEEFMRCGSPPPTDTLIWAPELHLVDEACLGTEELGVYFQRTVQVGTLSMIANPGQDTLVFKRMPPLFAASRVVDKSSNYHAAGVFRTDVTYMVLELREDVYVIAEAIGESSLGSETVLEVSKRGSIRFSSHESFRDFRMVTVIYYE